MDINLGLFGLDPAVIFKLLLSLLLGGIVGLERDWTGHSAGLRTNMLISLSACLFMAVALHLDSTDTRMASQIVTGVGFLGAGAVLHTGNRVLGLTTASTIWLMAGIGMAVGAGAYALAILTTIIGLASLHTLAPVRDWIDKQRCQHCRTLPKGHKRRTVRKGGGLRLPSFRSSALR